MGAADRYATPERTLRALKRASLPACPENYELWHTHLSQSNERLSCDLEDQFRKQGVFTEEACRVLYQKYFAPSHIQREITSSLQEMWSRISGPLIRSLEEAETKAIEERTGDEFLRSLQTLLADIRIASGDLQYQTAFLEERLSEASRKVASLRRRNNFGTNRMAVDPLTGIGTRGHFDEEMIRHTIASRRQQQDMCLMLVELDGFYESDGQHDLETIEKTISSAAALLNSNIKGQDVLCRFDDFIFAIILPHTKLEFSRLLAERLRTALRDAALPHPLARADGHGCVTFSIGIAAFRETEESSEILDRATLCLTRAGANGGDQINCHETPRSHPRTEITLMPKTG